MKSHRLARLRWAVRVSMMALVALVVAEPVSAAVAQVVDPPRAVITGSVFEDRDGDGARSATEPGVAGVSVSDGVTIVATGAGGEYRLELDPERRITDLVFITQPAGYAVPTDEFMTPRFYRGLGQLTDGDERTVDFPLLPDERSRSSNFTFANVADPHVNPQLPEQVRQINTTSRDIAFIQVSGDLTDNATDAEFTRYRAATAGSSVPVWPAVGNHEYFTSGGTGYPVRIDNYRRYVGPEWYSFDYGDRHFLVLENNGQAPFQEQLDWVERDLATNAEGKQLVVLAHQPMNVPFGSPSTYDAYGELLADYGAELVLVGHEHANDVEPDSTFVPTAKHVQTNSSSYTIDNSPRGFRYVHMRGDRFENPFRMYGVERMLTITDPAPGTRLPGLTGIQVNAYHTTEDVRLVQYRLDGGGWRRMRASGGYTWHSLPVGARPGPGSHTVEVEALGADGVRWSATSTFEVTGEQPVVPVAGADWPQHHGGAGHAGVAADPLEPGLRLAWSHRTQATFLTGSPVIADGVVYAGTRDEDGVGGAAVHAIDLATGERLWQFPVPSSVHGSVAVDGGRVFVPSLRGSLFALDASDGSLLWQRDPEPAPAPNNQRAYSYYSPTVAEGKVFWAYQTRFGPASQGLLAALDPATGAAIWEAPMTGATMSDGAPAVADGRVYVGNQTADRVIAYDATTGARLWVSSAILGGWQDGIPTAAGGRVYIGSNNGIVARDAATGADLWSYRSPHPSLVSSGSTPSAAAVDGNTVYMGFPSGAVTALDASTGTVRWDRLLPGTTYLGGVMSSPAVSGDTVFVGANNGRLYALDRQTGQPRWQYEVGTWVAAGPAVSGNTLVAGAWDGNLYAFTPGGEAASRWATVSGTVTDGATGAVLPGTRVVATRPGAEPTATTTGADGRYVLGLEPGTYTVATARRGYLTTEASAGTVEVGASGDHPLDLELIEVTGPVVGSGTTPPDYGAASTRLDVPAGDPYHFAMNDRVQATISSRTAANNQPGAFVPGSLADLFLLDETATETLDWSELILSRTADDPARQWGRSGEWLNLGDVRVDGDAVVAEGPAQIDASLQTSVRYRALPGAPVVKATVEIANTGTADFTGFFQYLIDPDSTQDVAVVPGIAGTNPGFVTAGWTANYVYDGPQTPVRSPAHGLAWVEDQPIGLSAFGFIAGLWFDASVPAGGSRTISWYHITDYPGAGSPAANVARWAAQLDTLDDEVPDRSTVSGTVSFADTGEPAAGAVVTAFGDDGEAVATGWTADDGQYALALEPGRYTVQATTLGYAPAAAAVELTAGTGVRADLTLAPVTVAASTGKTLTGGLVEAGLGDVVIENQLLALAVSRAFQDPQLLGSTVGKPVDVAISGRGDQIDWFNLPYVAGSLPLGTEAWQQATVTSTEVEIVQSTPDQAVVRVTGSAEPDLRVVTTYTARPDQPWITAVTRFENLGGAAFSGWVGDAIDHDGAGQHSGVAGHGPIRTPYADPRPYPPAGAWIGMTGNDPQTYGLIYAPGTGSWSAYGNGNWIMSRVSVTIPAGGSYDLTRRIVAAPASQPDAFAVLEELAAGP